ncbi:AraC family transcriptional regulator [Amycolatopsis acidiphila]|uniref:AraC family transcriptional regulator n=1 Tax=Amycolatopsis acidiphila TaxID=715473 RepID=A0A558AN32_9PSEU|nr:helix-turn-helix transcriptional regulator [Amycolatopsis acidiphila]TVT25678.1 AraC family transcriptional regulator [Amycolatopsis acidiphila]UIJ60434.1 AraC family transcriptional regulator [Amycolatopsis acidiphila]GHG90192.1 hypothetical protein GCM10017788_65260 [Amycolatopsis acidiphila]
MAEETQEGDALLGPHILHIQSGHELARRQSPGPSGRLLAGKLAADCQASLELLQPQSDYVVLVVLTERVVVRHGDAYLEAGNGSLLAAAPHQRLSIEFGPDSLVRVVRIDPAFVHARLAPRLAFPPEGLVSFAPVVTSLRGANDTVTKSLLRFLTGAPGRFTERSEEVFVDWLLHHQQHTYSGRSRDRVERDEVAAYVQLLMDNYPFVGRMEYYARAAGVTLRDLIAAFRESGCLPHEYLRSVRLDCVRRLLESGECSSVRKAVTDCGFRENVQFHRWYFQQYGESPWETLRRARSE